jgi:hypothetical protein
MRLIGSLYENARGVYMICNMSNAVLVNVAMPNNI